MKFTETFFKFPIRIYDNVSIVKNMKREMKNQDEDDEEISIPDWVRGEARIPHWALPNIFYSDAYSTGRQPEHVAEEGFDTTFISSIEFGEFECMWKVGKFERELDAFKELMEAWEAEEEKKCNDSSSSTETK